MVERLAVSLKAALALPLLGLLAAYAPAQGGNKMSGAQAEWPLAGGGPMAQRFSLLSAITPANAAQLGLAWSLDLGTRAGQEATPVFVGGILYTVSAYDIVRAIDARNGKVLWTFDPGVMEAAARSCCGPVSRGVAVQDGRVYLGALDGRLIALDAKSGKRLWQVDTLDHNGPPAVNYTITGTPRVVKGMVIIGNGGAEFGARGFITAYDAATGRKKWRFYTVPGRPGQSDGEISDAPLARVADTWHGRWWQWGGGGTVWDAIEYDPELDLLYIGTGNGSPTNHGLRSDGQGDNLFLSSIVALRPDNGAYVWHYQETPGEAWDYTATQPIIMADLKLDGRPRKVLMQAPKNGFFYMLDRATGELLSAHPFAKTNWASHVDMATGRPVENPDARYYKTGKSFLQWPSSGGAHNWQPMAFSPQTGLVYLPVMEMAIPFAPGGADHMVPGVYNTGTAMQGGASFSRGQLAAMARDNRGYLVAWDPVGGKALWKVPLAAPFNGGVLATAGGVVFQGNGSRQFAAYDARNGRRLWSYAAQTGIVAAPMTYAVGGVQYVAVMAGWGGAWPMLGGQLAEQPVNGVGPNRLLVFRLGGKSRLPAPEKALRSPLSPPPATFSLAQITLGDRLYGENCLRCHGIAAVSASMVPDLRHSGAIGDADVLKQVVLEGALRSRGMPSFAGVLSAADAEAIRAYLIHRANADRNAERQAQK